MSEDTTPSAQLPAMPKASLWRSFNAVAWGFLGVRGSIGFRADGAQLHPFYLIGAGIVATLLFVLFLMVLVNWIVKT